MSVSPQRISRCVAIAPFDGKMEQPFLQVDKLSIHGIDFYAG